MGLRVSSVNFDEKLDSFKTDISREEVRLRRTLIMVMISQIKALGFDCFLLDIVEGPECALVAACKQNKIHQIVTLSCYC